MTRFYNTVDIAPGGGGHGIMLDGKPARTREGRPLSAPSRDLADAIAAEWRAQGDDFDTGAMPLTALANAALDQGPVAPEVAGYGSTDLLCYRADGPDDLVALQEAAWDPLLAWAAGHHGARLVVTRGITPVAQDARALKVLREAVEACGPFTLAGLHGVVTVAGSLIIGLAVLARRLTGEQAWRASRIDEDYQEHKWGAVEEASPGQTKHHADLLAAAQFMLLSGGA